MLASERRVYIMNCLNNQGIVSLKELAADLNISEITVRRDLEKLEAAGKLKRVHGGAARDDILDNVELTMNSKAHINENAKELVAKKAAELVKDGDCIFLDGGTSIAPLAEYLAPRNVKIVTYNDLILQKIIQPKAEVFIIGGTYLPYYMMNIGPEAQESLKKYHFDIAFFGCSAIDIADRMTFVTNIDSLLMKQIALGESDQNVLLLDETKLGKRAFMKFVSLDHFDRIFCNRQNTDIRDSKIEFIN